MKVYIQVINKTNGVYQTGMIDEPVLPETEVNNALRHFGVSYAEVIWTYNTDEMKFGKVEGTNKVVSVICCD